MNPIAQDKEIYQQMLVKAFTTEKAHNHLPLYRSLTPRLLPTPEKPDFITDTKD